MVPYSSPAQSQPNSEDPIGIVSGIVSGIVPGSSTDGYILKEIPNV